MYCRPFPSIWPSNAPNYCVRRDEETSSEETGDSATSDWLPHRDSFGTTQAAGPKALVMMSRAHSSPREATWPPLALALAMAQSTFPEASHLRPPGFLHDRLSPQSQIAFCNTGGRPIETLPVLVPARSPPTICASALPKAPEHQSPRKSSIDCHYLFHWPLLPPSACCGTTTPA